jgi:integrase
VANTTGSLRRAYAHLLSLPAIAITVEQLEAVWDDLIARGLPSAAHCAYAHAQALFNWAVTKRRLKANPMKGANAPCKPPSRDHTLTGEEARLVWAAAERLGPTYGTLIRFLLGTGVRFMEAAEAEWSEFNADRSEWTIPTVRMKGGQAEHIVPVPPILRDLLLKLPRFAGSNLVFTSDGKRPATGSSDLKRKLDEALAGTSVARFRLHDFRRTITTWLARQGVDSLVADKLLAHTTSNKLGAVALIYNRFDFLGPRRDALVDWTSFLDHADATSAPPSAVPASAKDPEPAVDSGRQVHLLVMNPDEVRKEAIATAKIFYDLVATVQADPQVIKANCQLLKLKPPARWIAGCRGGNPHSIAFLRAAELRAQLLLNPCPVSKESVVEADRADWNDHLNSVRSAAEAARTRAKNHRVAAEQARALDQVEYAVRHEAEAQAAEDLARQDEAAAGVWEQMIAGALPKVGDSRIVRNFSNWSLADPTAQARGCQEIMCDFFREVFDRSCDTAAVAYTNAFGAGVSVPMGRRRRLERAAQ